MKIIVTGPRDWDDSPVRTRALWLALSNFMPAVTLIIHGGASGADSVARHWAHVNDIKEKVYAARWHDSSSATYDPSRRYDPYAGHRRNEEMAAENPDAAYVLACRFESKKDNKDVWTPGTGNMVKECCRPRGLTVVEVIA